MYTVEFNALFCGAEVRTFANARAAVGWAQRAGLAGRAVLRYGSRRWSIHRYGKLIPI